jgi:hypothetical protein
MGAGSAAFRVAVTRGLLKPLLNLPLNPRLGWHGLRMGARAAVDGWRGRLGRSVEPETG